MNPAIPWPLGVEFGAHLLQKHDSELFGNTMALLRRRVVAVSPIAANLQQLPPSPQAILPMASKATPPTLRTTLPTSAPETGGGPKKARQVRSSKKGTAKETPTAKKRDRPSATSEALMLAARFTHRHHHPVFMPALRRSNCPPRLNTVGCLPKAVIHRNFARLGLHASCLGPV